ncbi:MAG: glutathione S-transferase N-terminal domain-containing protein [Gammaproteobacteria bacterium]|nr:glutathione S-transferase N-terminal domain-containing protein [Gammaproteobacteria bacterium]
MIDLYSWSTPNGRKASIMLEETGLEYCAHAVDIGKGEQFAAEFLKISPNNKIPAIVDRETEISLMESGAILIYLAEKTGQFLPSAGEPRARVLEWLMFQMGGIGPMLGQVHHFLRYHPDVSEYAAVRYSEEGKRLYGVLDKRLSHSEYLGGSDYSIADIVTWPWISRFEWQQIDLDEYPHVREWYTTVAARPAVQRGYDVPRKTNKIPLP